MLLVAAAVITQGDKILIARRGPHKSHAGCWEFPGGKIEPGESFEAALRREILEELSLTIQVGEMVTTVHNQRIEMRAFRVTVVDGEPQLRDHDQLAWLDKQGLTALPMTELDLGVVAAL